VAFIGLAKENITKKKKKREGVLFCEHKTGVTFAARNDAWALD